MYYALFFIINILGIRFILINKCFHCFQSYFVETINITLKKCKFFGWYHHILCIFNSIRILSVVTSANKTL